ncbi:MAG: GNAT family N-acetyltransferase [Desulfovibrionaceae bacterium]|nr:GNAT family N-acetyltransferase [Desulfovibrionaceae bacterium]
MDTDTLLHRNSEDDAPATSRPAGRPRAHSAIVPIREIGAHYREQIKRHLLDLDGRDRYLRFGYAANDRQIGQYVDSLKFERDHLFGIFNRKLDLIATAHLAYPADIATAGVAEFGVSVSRHARGRGYGARLFERSAIHAVNDGVQTLYIHALSENTAMLRIARNAGAEVERFGSECEAHLKLPAANFRSRFNELLGDRVGQMDYLLKTEVSLARNLLAAMQEGRNGARAGRHESGE